jgi:hypothetical protein
MVSINEGLRKKDLEYLVGNKLHIDEFDSKMGDNEDVVTINFKVKQRMPAEDLVSYLENGYDWVLDADVSTGEIDDGEFLVFVEFPRRKTMFKNLLDLIKDLENLTDVKLKDWKFRWYKLKEYHKVDEENLNDIVPNSPEKYIQYIEQFDDVEKDKSKLTDEISTIKRLSGIG